MGKRSLVILDINHIKNYVFATDKLKEIRGASSALDRLNRQDMRDIAKDVDPNAQLIFANGGAGLFEVDTGEADKFGMKVQQKFKERTAGSATITYTIQELPDRAINDSKAKIKDELAMMRYKLREAKNCPADTIVLPSHPFMRPCSSCGIEYAEDDGGSSLQDRDEQDALFCASCQKKRREDIGVKESIDYYVGTQPVKKPGHIESPLWQEVIRILHDTDYHIPKGTQRPGDFNDFRNFGNAKDYIGLIYADGNGMGSTIEELDTRPEIHDFAKAVHTSIYKSVCDAIREHLPVWEGINQESGEEEHLFQFDLLLLGGDDLVIVTPASSAMDVALTTAKRFNELTRGWGPAGKGYTLSVGVILAPIKYPFGLLQELAETTLKAAKKGRGTKEEQEKRKKQSISTYGETSINFMVVSGSTSHDFDKVYKKMSSNKKDVTFYATLRPYSVEELEFLLTAIRNGRKHSLGRTKLHQLREAILKMNLTTSVGESLALLRNWRERQREFVYKYLYESGKHLQEQHEDIEKPGTLFPRVTFPWFADGDNAYRTSLLDFVELYDFVASEGDSGTEDR